ncbi:hypothetical protein B0H14DRAFT_2724449 [Mycena olivaceomarginata]|nr:hypothetical protein B0H14DRAFT_2724449 [Mycena olivaceomarginata]
MWTKFSSALKSKQAQDGEASGTEALAGPSSSSPVKRKSVLKRDDGSLRLNSPLKLASIPKKVKTTFNLHVNTSQLTLSAEPLPSSSSSRDLARRSSQDLLSSNTAPRPKAARRSSFNILTRRPSLDLLRSPPETPRSTRREEPSDATCGRNRAATFEGSVRSILREPNTPGTAKSVRFGRDADMVARESAEATFSRSTPPEQVFLDRLQQSGSTSTSMPRLASSSRSNRPSVIEIFAPSTDPSQSSEPDLTSLFQGLDIPPISSLSTGLHVPNSDLPAALTSTPHKDGNKGSSGPSREDSSRLAPRSHDRSASFSFGQTVFHATADDSASNRSSSGNSSLISDSDSNMTSSSSSPSVSRNRAFSDTAFMSMLRGSSSKTSSPKVAQPSISESFDMVTTTDSTVSVPDPFSADATTYYTPQTMINTTPPGSQSRSRHVRTASREESLIFSLETQLDLQTELCGQFEADLRARDELVEVLRNKLIEAEEDDAKKVRFLRAWKNKVAELERTCQFLEDEVEGSRQESMDRSVMDEASSEALRMLHRQIAALERERDAWRRTEAVLREELRRLETLASERRNEAVRLRNSLGSLSDKQAQERMAEDALKAAVASLEKSGEEQKQRHEAAEMAWRVENEDLQRNNAELVDELLVSKQRLSARDDEIAELKAELVATRDRAIRTVEVTEAGKCALAMERDSLKLQVAKLQEKHLRTEVAEQKALELEDDLRGVWDVKQSLEKERDQLKVQLKGSENRALELEQERQYALDSVSRLEDNIRRRDLGAATEMQEFREQMDRLKQEHAAALEAALQDGTRKRLEIDAQTTTLFELQTEVERLKGQTRELQQESADKEVHILQITKQRAQDKQDLEGLNIALDSKQQELELLKRRVGVRGTAGNTPSQSSKPTHTHQRRESSVSVAPRMSRPSSFTSEFGVDLTRERKPSAEGSTKIAALSKSTRLNTSTSVLPTPSKRGSMGPPPLRSRSSIVGTPTIASRTLNRSSSATVVAGKAKTVKSPTAASPPSPATQQNKENTDALRRASDVPPASRRLSTSRIPIPTFAQ